MFKMIIKKKTVLVQSGQGKAVSIKTSGAEDH